MSVKISEIFRGFVWGTVFSSYPPISVLPCFFKYQKKSMYKKIIAFIFRKMTLNKNQNGFRKKSLHQRSYYGAHWKHQWHNGTFSCMFSIKALWKLKQVYLYSRPSWRIWWPFCNLSSHPNHLWQEKAMVRALKVWGSPPKSQEK